MILPSAVYFCIAFPLDEKTFLKNGQANDFIWFLKQKDNSVESLTWTNYENEIVKPCMALIENYKQFGFHFIINCSFEQFLQITNERQQELVILFTHCKDGGKEQEAIEFADGLFSWNRILSAIPAGYEKILDFGVCQP